MYVSSLNRDALISADTNTKYLLHYMKKNAEADKPFTLNSHVRERLDMWEGC